MMKYHCCCKRSFFPFHSWSYFFRWPKHSSSLSGRRGLHTVGHRLL